MSSLRKSAAKERKSDENNLLGGEKGKGVAEAERRRVVRRVRKCWGTR